MRALPAMLAVILPGLALAEGRSVTIVNGTGETLRRIQIAPAGSASAGENRLRSTLPPHAQAQIGYSTGCRADIRLGFDSGRTEEFLDQDVCTGLRITAGGGVATASDPTLANHAVAKAKPVKPGKPVIPVTVEVPPWTGHSITKKFGGLD